uniref:CCHC-type domain-containing protein n=1 Tax=Strongyloides stercoralis TaxID=6248 RepID=A0A0K0EC01_STRER
MLRLPNSIVKKIRDIEQNYEVIKNYLRNVYDGECEKTSTKDQNKFEIKKKSQNESRRQRHRNSINHSNDSDDQKNDSMKLRCTFCQKVGNEEKECYKKQGKCFKCRGNDHVAALCRKKIDRRHGLEKKSNRNNGLKTISCKEEVRVGNDEIMMLEEIVEVQFLNGNDIICIKAGVIDTSLVIKSNFSYILTGSDMLKQCKNYLVDYKKNIVLLNRTIYKAVLATRANASELNIQNKHYLRVMTQNNDKQYNDIFIQNKTEISTIPFVMTDMNYKKGYKLPKICRYKNKPSVDENIDENV